MTSWFNWSDKIL